MEPPFISLVVEDDGRFTLIHASGTREESFEKLGDALQFAWTLAATERPAVAIGRPGETRVFCVAL